MAITKTYQWYRGSTAISGATGLTYTLTEQDVDTAIKVIETATNEFGNASVTTLATNVIGTFFDLLDTRLRWKPPVLVNPVIWEVPVGYAQSVVYPDDQDVFIQMPTTMRTNNSDFQLRGGRNVVVIGGHSRGRMTFSEVTGHVYIEGVEIDLTGAPNKDAIVVATTDPTKAPNVTIQNVRVTGVQGTNAGVHADIFQNQGHIRDLRVDKFTGDTNYQGFFIRPEYGIRSAIFSRINLKFNTLGTPAGNSYLYWFRNDATQVAFDDPKYFVKLEEVYGQANSQFPLRTAAFPFPGTTVEAEPTPSAYAGVVDQDGNMSWPVGSEIVGSVIRGDPASGDFVSAANVGLSYVAAKSFQENNILELVLPSGIATYSENNLTKAAEFDAWLGYPAALQLAYFNQTSWSNFDASIPYIASLFNGLDCIWNVPLAAEYGTLPSVVGGTHDALFLECANAVLDAAPSSGAIIVRIGWEFNLLGQEQRAFDGNGNPDPNNWVAAYRRVVGIFRSVSNRFRFDWCPNASEAVYEGLTIEDCYPGDDVVDIIGLDLYFNSAFDTADPLAVFNYKKNMGTGLQWQVNFANSHGKPYALTEWGVNSNTATSYMQAQCEWLVNNNYLYHGYWDSDAAIATRISNGNLPAIGAIYKQFFGTPEISVANTFSAAENQNFVIPLTANQNVTWTVVSGNATVSGNTLTVVGVAASNVPIVVRAENERGFDQITITVSFVAPYTFANTEASSYVARMTVPPTENRKIAIDTLIGSLKTSGCYAKFDTLYLFASHDRDAALLNVIANTDNASRVNEPTFEVNRGYTGSGVGAKHITTNRSNTASGKMVRNSAGFGYWELTNLASNAGGMGNGAATTLNARQSDNRVGGFIHDYTTIASAVNSSMDSRGLIVGNRSSATARQIYKDGISVYSDAAASSNPTAANILFCTATALYPEARQIAVGFTGSSLTAQNVADLHSALRTYLQSVGAVTA